MAGITSSLIGAGLGIASAASAKKQARRQQQLQEQALQQSTTQLNPFSISGLGGMGAGYMQRAPGTGPALGMSPGDFGMGGMPYFDGWLGGPGTADKISPPYMDFGGFSGWDGGQTVPGLMPGYFGQGQGYSPQATVNLSAGDLEGVRSALSQYAQQAVPGGGNQLPPQIAAMFRNLQRRSGGPDLDTGMLDFLQGSVAGRFDEANQALGQLGTQGFQRGLAGTAFAGAGRQLADLDASYGQAFDRTLGTLREQARPFEQRAFDTLSNDLFATGRLGTTGGSMQTEAFARGLGQADLSRVLQASQEARAARESGLGLAQGMAGLGQGLAGQEDALLQSAFGRFAQTAGLASDLNTQRFQRSMYGNELGFNRAQQLLGTGVSLAGLPASLQSAQLGNALQALQGQSGITQQVLSLFGAGLSAEQAAANARIGAGSNMAAIVGSPAFATAGYGTANAYSQLANAINPGGGGGLIESIRGLFNRGGSGGAATPSGGFS